MLPKETKMVLLIGITNYKCQEVIGEQVIDHFERTPIATFDDETMAKNYVNQSKTPRERQNAFMPNQTIFKNNSLLKGCENTEIESLTELPHNPTI